MKNNENWMKENKIKMVKPEKTELPLNGIPSTVFSFDTTDENGPTKLEFVMMPGGNNRLIMITLWGSDAERKKHGAAIDSMMTASSRSTKTLRRRGHDPPAAPATFY